VEIVGDSQAAEAIFRKGGSQRADADSGELELFEAFLDIIRTAAEAGFDVVFRWVPASSWSTPMRSPSSMIGMISA
jgi:hypothetical protein